MLKQYMRKYVNSFKNTLKVMFGVSCQSLDTTQNFIKITDDYIPLNNLTVQIPFFGTVVGDFFLSVNEEAWSRLMLNILKESNQELHRSSLKEFLNIITGDAITILSEDFINLTYLAPRIIRGSMEFPAVERVSSTLYSDELGEIELVLCIDMMKMEINKELEKILSQIQDKDKLLIHTDRLSTLGTMAASIMHEVNNPVSFISGNVQILQDYYLPEINKYLKENQLPEEHPLVNINNQLPKVCNSINNGITRIKTLTERLKSFSRASNNDMSHINLNICVDSAITFAKGTMPKSIQIDFQKKKSIKPVFGDEQQLEQVMINLIVNASHALENTPSPKISIRITQVGSYALIKVKDNGPGIHQKLLSKVWDPFFTTKDKSKGTGLGLAISKDILQSHKGQIDYTGDENGAEFTVKLPVLDITKCN